MDMNEEYGLTPYETREILFYKTDNGDVRVEILLYQENLWLTQAKMAELFEVQKAAISKHLKNIFESGELLEEAVVSKMETTAADGKRYNINYYNLDAIIAVGYRVNSRKATMFRIWANRVLKEFIIKGYVRCLPQGGQSRSDMFCPAKHGIFQIHFLQMPLQSLRSLCLCHAEYLPR